MGGAISDGCFTAQNYIIGGAAHSAAPIAGPPGEREVVTVVAIFRKGPGPYALAVAISGVKMGERFLEIGSGTPGMFAAIAATVGLTGRACAVVDTDEEKQALETASARAGVLVEVQLASSGRVPHPDASFDAIVVDATSGKGRELRPQVFAEAYRALRVGGRLIIVTRLRNPIVRVFVTPPPHEQPAAIEESLRSAAFRPVRQVAEREGLRFVEGMKPA